MMRAGAVAAGLLLVLPAIGETCEDGAKGLLFSSCGGPVEVELLLLPEDATRLSEPSALVVTGGYTGIDNRDSGTPNPVGLFVDDGRVVNPTLAPMDGILVIGPEPGTLALHHRARMPGGLSLLDTASRRQFAAQMAERGASVLQSHLLIVDGQVDVREQPEAPRAFRRILFTKAGMFGIWQGPAAQTLHEATMQLAAEHTPDMALNLDMGSYDFCLRGEQRCGVLGPGQIARLSNLLVFRRGW